MYYDIQSNDSDCELTATSGASTYHFPHIVLYNDVLGDPQCYFARGSGTSLAAILGSNAEVGQTVSTYYLNNGTTTEYESVYLSASVPADYFENVRTRYFTLAQRS